MSALSFSKISASLNAVLAAIGLLTVAALTMPDLTDQSSASTDVVLAGVWAA